MKPVITYPRTCTACPARLSNEATYHAHRRKEHPELLQRRPYRPRKKSTKAMVRKPQPKPMEIHDEQQERQLENHISYAFGRAQRELEIYAQSLDVPSALIADRVGELLRMEAHGAVLRSRHRLHPLSRKAA